MRHRYLNLFLSCLLLSVLGLATYVFYFKEQNNQSFFDSSLTQKADSNKLEITAPSFTCFIPSFNKQFSIHSNGSNMNILIKNNILHPKTFLSFQRLDMFILLLDPNANPILQNSAPTITATNIHYDCELNSITADDLSCETEIYTQINDFINKNLK